jgi:hypothetical protein
MAEEKETAASFSSAISRIPDSGLVLYIRALTVTGVAFPAPEGYAES